LKHAADARYGATPITGLVERILASQRRKMFEAFMLFKQSAPDGSILDVRMKPATSSANGHYLFAWSDSQARTRIAACEIDMSRVRLPHADGAFDWVFCSETIEHAGSAERQYALMQELYRVARKGVFVTTANRRHPIEFKTGLPLIHLLPAAWWRRLLKWLGKKRWASEAALNPLDAAALYRFAGLLPGKPEHDVGHKRVFGIKAHFFMMIVKRKS
jgi:SAM-dependent methyltransferase